MFTIQWTVISFILYAEIGIILLLLLPWIRPSWWKKIFDSRLIMKFKRFSRIYSYAYIFVLLLLFFDATREVSKYSKVEDNMDNARIANADSFIHMRLFRAQRNLYICGFALLLFLAIKRIVMLLARSANLEAATAAAFNKDINNQNLNNESGAVLEEEMRQLKEKIRHLELSRNKVNKKVQNVKENLNEATSSLNHRQKRLNSGDN